MVFCMFSVRHSAFWGKVINLFCVAIVLCIKHWASSVVRILHYCWYNGSVGINQLRFPSFCQGLRKRIKCRRCSFIQFYRFILYSPYKTRHWKHKYTLLIWFKKIFLVQNILMILKVFSSWVSKDRFKKTN